MSIRILKKALGLLIVDIVIIIGIFVLQFRTDSSIIKKIGNLQITLETQKSPSGEISYKNKVRVSYNGINFVCDDTNPAVIIKDGIQSPVQLKDVEQTEPLSLTLNFTEGVKVTFELASEAPDSSLAILADLPNGISDFSIPYSYSSNMSIQKAEKDSLVLAGKRSLWELEGHAVDAGRFDFTPRNYVAAYSVYDENQKFSFDSIVNEPIASAEEFAKTIGQFKRKLIAAFQANNVESNITEQVAVSYIAAQAEAGNYLRAVETVPDSVKKSKQRTYLSAPYFNTLEDMNENLEKVLKDYELRISESAEKGTLTSLLFRKLQISFICIRARIQYSNFLRMRPRQILQHFHLLKFLVFSVFTLILKICLMPMLQFLSLFSTAVLNVLQKPAVTKEIFLQFQKTIPSFRLIRL